MPRNFGQSANFRLATNRIAENSSGDEKLTESFSSVTATGGQLSDMLIMTIKRIGATTADDYGADARFLEFDIHYQIDSRGSESEFIKASTE